MKGVQVPIEGGYVNVALLRDGARRCAAVVSGLDDVRTMIVTPAAGIGLDPELVSGTVLVDAGQPVLVLNADVLIRRSFGSTDYLRDLPAGLGAPRGWQPVVDRSGATILVVDDSLTTRTLEKSVLEAQGYRVLMSVDGLDALGRLRSGESVIDLILADVEMPRMDGFGLLQAIRNDPHLSSLPVVLMTSREDPEDIRRGLDLGANAYLTKQKFDQRELLATIGQML